MGKKRKSSDVGDAEKVEEIQPERRKRTLLGWKDKPLQNDDDGEATSSSSFPIRNKEKDNKVDSKETKGATLNELVELRNYSSCLFFESRKHKDLYLWMPKFPDGPSVKFLVKAVHTMEELKLTGNHLKGSRPVLTVSLNFNKDAHWRLLKELIIQIFGTPKGHHKSKPYHDHAFAFSIVNGHIWFTNYQIAVSHNESDKLPRGGLEKMTLVEVDPRFCVNPIKIFRGSFGVTLYENPFYVSPNQIRSMEEKKKAGKFSSKVKAKTRRKMHVLSNPLEPDEFADLWKE